MQQPEIPGSTVLVTKEFKVTSTNHSGSKHVSIVGRMELRPIVQQINALVQGLTFWDAKRNRAVPVYNDLLFRQEVGGKFVLGMNHQVQKEIEGEIFVIIMDTLAFHGFHFHFEYDVNFSHIKAAGYGGASMTTREVFVFKQMPSNPMLRMGSARRNAPPSAPLKFPTQPSHGMPQQPPPGAPYQQAPPPSARHEW